jgi:hypothetical protein
VRRLRLSPRKILEAGLPIVGTSSRINPNELCYETSEVFVYVAMSRLMARRLARTS